MEIEEVNNIITNLSNKNLETVFNKSSNYNKNSLEIVNNNVFKIILHYKIQITPSIFNEFINENIINLLEKKYLNKVIGVFYILEINTNILKKAIMPLISLHNLDNMYLSFNLLSKIIYFSIDETLELRVKVMNNEIFGLNKYLQCKIINLSQASIIKNENYYEIIIENIKMKENEKIMVTIKNLFSNTNLDVILAEGVYVKN